MRKKYIAPSDREAVQALLDAAQARARVRTITPDTIRDAISDLDARLPISKAAREGCTCEYDRHAQDFPSAYKRMGTPESTIVDLVFRRGSWWITRVRRGETSPASCRYRVHLTDAARAAIIRAAETFS